MGKLKLKLMTKLALPALFCLLMAVQHVRAGGAMEMKEVNEEEDAGVRSPFLTRGEAVEEVEEKEEEEYSTNQIVAGGFIAFFSIILLVSIALLSYNQTILADVTNRKEFDALAQYGGGANEKVRELVHDLEENLALGKKSTNTLYRKCAIELGVSEDKCFDLVVASLEKSNPYARLIENELEKSLTVGDSFGSLEYDVFRGFVDQMASNVKPRPEPVLKRALDYAVPLILFNDLKMHPRISVERFIPSYYGELTPKHKDAFLHYAVLMAERLVGKVLRDVKFMEQTNLIQHVFFDLKLFEITGGETKK